MITAKFGGTAVTSLLVRFFCIILFEVKSVADIVKKTIYYSVS